MTGLRAETQVSSPARTGGTLASAFGLLVVPLGLASSARGAGGGITLEATGGLLVGYDSPGVYRWGIGRPSWL